MIRRQTPRLPGGDGRERAFDLQPEDPQVVGRPQPDRPDEMTISANSVIASTATAVPLSVAGQRGAETTRLSAPTVARGGDSAMPEVVADALIQTPTSEVGRAGDRLGQVPSQYGLKHPVQFGGAAEVDELRCGPRNWCRAD